MTGELSSPERAGRRAEDTGIFVVELLTQGLDSVRGSVTLARMNYIHSRWSKHISRDDMLFTLSLFIFEPITFAAKYEWRAHSPLERQAIFMFWAEIGARMGIEDIPATLEELRDWKEQYATDNMIYAKTNGLVGELTMDVLVAPLPSFLKSFGKEAAKTFIEPRVLQAFGWEPASPAFLCWLMPALLHFRGLILRNLIFPRTRPPKFELTSEIVTTRPDGSEDRLVQREGFLFEPWYVAPGQSAIGKFGIGKPGDKVKWLSEGWKSETLGPDRLMDQGVDFAITEGERIRQAGMLCPFFRPTYK